MANNLIIKDALGANQTLATQNPSGVHTPEHIITSVPLDPFGLQADTAVVGDTSGSISAKLRGILKVFGLSLPATLGQKVMAASLPVCFASDQTGLTVGALTGSESHIGQVTKPFALSAPSLTITVASPYLQNYCVGGIISFTNSARVASGSGRIISVLLIDANIQNAQFTLLLFSANPSASTFTNGVLGLLNATDFPHLLGSIDIVNYTTIGDITLTTAKSFARADSLIPFVLPSGTTLYGVLLVKSGSNVPSYTTTSSLSISLIIDQN